MCSAHPHDCKQHRGLIRDDKDALLEQYRSPYPDSVRPEKPKNFKHLPQQIMPVEFGLSARCSYWIEARLKGRTYRRVRLGTCDVEVRYIKTNFALWPLELSSGKDREIRFKNAYSICAGLVNLYQHLRRIPSYNRSFGCSPARLKKRSQLPHTTLYTFQDRNLDFELQ